MNGHHLTGLLRLNHGLYVPARPFNGSCARRASPASGAPGTACPRPASSSRWTAKSTSRLKDRGPPPGVLAALDDPTDGCSQPSSFGLRRARGHFLLLRQLVRRYGPPAPAYTDRHGIFPRVPRSTASAAPRTPEPPGYDTAVPLGGQLLQIPRAGRSCAGTRVDVHAHLGGSPALRQRRHRPQRGPITSHEHPSAVSGAIPCAPRERGDWTPRRRRFCGVATSRGAGRSHGPPRS